ncbi:hypothetical protein ACC862_03415 [Rhizobium ruizarguesonis]
MLRDTLIPLAITELGVDVTAEAAAAPDAPIVDLLSRKGGAAFSKYKLAKAYLRWTRDHATADLSVAERTGWTKLFAAINAALK